MAPLLIGVVCGAVSVVTGAFCVGSWFQHFAQLAASGHDGSIPPSTMAEIALVSGETAITASFCLVSLALALMRDRLGKDVAMQRFFFRAFAICAGAARLLALAAMLGFFWSPGWYYILDPVRQNKAPYLILLLSALQALFYFFAGGAAGKLPKTPAAK